MQTHFETPLFSLKHWVLSPHGEGLHGSLGISGNAAIILLNKIISTYLISTYLYNYVVFKLKNKQKKNK